MICPKCGSGNFKCIDSRAYSKKGVEYIYRLRRHKCQTCGNRFSTYELPVSEYMEMKIKSEQFDKLISSLKKVGEEHEKSVADTICSITSGY